ncbi:MAG: hypothetical protein QN173_09450 [Armatimonadota bacterium]|nr:hypothetical protein [Armatimonadota bacterium]MDR7438001.1 hypothetical protein [Armatimonadota bacterium]MDR7471839.1 hypothetical protein [Armatimonadota bacterium]MDR7507814.1 hypothetical protein [Armatimonadota bacterium]MDR7510153.1 hypothetical protein [Armatimonadota bacterium]
MRPVAGPPLPSDYYHALLGNGVDAVLIGYTGSMVADRIHGPDRCYWYKADRYYPPDIPVLPALDRRILLGPHFRPQPGEPWFELAPLARGWYDPGESLRSSRQRFDPTAACLTTTLAVAGGPVRVTTFLHARLPVLVERYAFPDRRAVRFWAAPGPWVPEPDDLPPHREAQPLPSARPVCLFRVGDVRVAIAMVTDPPPRRWGAEGEAIWVEVDSPRITRYLIVADDREERLPLVSLEAILERILDAVDREGAEGLWSSHREVWAAYHARSARLDIPSPALARVHAQTAYQLRAVQHPASGALPVNVLRSTWSSHIFWDAAFLHLALLQMGHREEAERACGFLDRLRPAAARAARDYGARGLKYEWEITHDGRPAYGVHRHLVHQVHNNGAYSLMCWHQYRWTRDIRVLRALYPVMAGIADFYMSGVVRPGPRLRPLTGIAELAEPVALDAATLASVVRALRVARRAADILGRDAERARLWEAVADGLAGLWGSLIADGVLRATEQGDLSWGVLPACSLMEIFPPDDPVVARTVRAFVAASTNPRHGIVGHGARGRGPRDGFPWAAGWAAAVLASAGAPQEAWAILRPVEQAVCVHGGLPEKVYEDGSWNMQYFTTAQAAVCLALHALVAHRVRDAIRIQAPPWPEGEFSGLHLEGLVLRGAWSRGRPVACTVANACAVPLRQAVEMGGDRRVVDLAPGEEVTLL